MLAWTVYISFLGVLVLMLLPKGNAAAARQEMKYKRSRLTS